MTRRLVAVAVATLCLATACGGTDRTGAQHELVDQLVEGGLQRDIAECVVEQFFAARSDDELKAFFDRADLTDDERAEFAGLGAGCTPD